MFRHGRPPLRFASRRRRGEAPARAESGLVRPFARCRSKGSPDRIQPCDSRAAPRAAGVPSSLSEAPAPASVRGPAGAGREQLAGGVATEENRGQMEPERERWGAAPARAGEPGAARRVPLRSRRGVGAGGVRRLPPRFRAAAARVGFPAASPPAAERAAPGEGPRAGGRARLEVAFSSSTSAFRGGVSSYPARSSAGPGGRVSPGRAPRAPPAPAGGARSAPPKAAAQRPPLLPRAGEAGGAAPGTGRASPRRAARPAERRSFAPAAAAADPGSLPEVRRERERGRKSGRRRAGLAGRRPAARLPG